MGPYQPLALSGEHPFAIDILHGTGFGVKPHHTAGDGVNAQGLGVGLGRAVSLLALNQRRDRPPNGYQPFWTRLPSPPPVLDGGSPNGKPAFSATMVRYFERARVGE